MTLARQLLIALRAFLVAAVVLGVIYPLVVWGIGAVVFPKQSTGSFVTRDGTVVGSELIGQFFAGDRYFHGRPSVTGTSVVGYDAMASGGSNLGPTSKRLAEQVQTRVGAYESSGQAARALVPADAAYASGSGLDPDISVAYASSQAARVAGVRGLSKAEVAALVADNTTGRDLGFLGEPRVNVLKLNLALDAASKGPAKRKP